MARRSVYSVAMILGLAWLCGAPSASFAQPVRWRHDYAAAQLEAMQANKPLMLDFSTTNCFWCKKLDASTFRDPRVVRLLNEHFIPLKLDGHREKMLVKYLQITGYPTLVLAMPEGLVTETIVGYVDADKFTVKLHELLQMHQRSKRAQEQLAGARRDYEMAEYLGCLDRCDHISQMYADLPAGEEAQKLAAMVLAKPEWMREACVTLTKRLGVLYMALADDCLKHGQRDEAMLYLDRVVHFLPDTPHAQTAATRLAAIRRDTGIKQTGATQP